MKLSKGQYLYKKGDASDCMYVVKSGKIALYSDGNDSITELAQLGVGQLVGDLSFFTHKDRTSDARALTEAEVLKVPYDVIKKQFESIPSWMQTMNMNLANQVTLFANEVRILKDPDGKKSISRLTIARAWAAMIFVSTQYGKKEGSALTVEWSMLRYYSNICFREVSDLVLKVATLIEKIGLSEVKTDKLGPVSITFKDIPLMNDFLQYYTQCITKNSKELDNINPLIFQTLQILSKNKIKETPIHRGQIEIDIEEFCKVARDEGMNEINATSLDLLPEIGIEIDKKIKDDKVKLRFHKLEVTNRSKFMEILLLFQDFNNANQAIVV